RFQHYVFSTPQFYRYKRTGNVISVLPQSGDPSDGSSAVETELQKSNLNARPVLQDDRYNPSTALDVSLLQCMSGDLSAGDSLPTSSPEGTYTLRALQTWMLKLRDEPKTDTLCAKVWKEQPSKG
ncbi:hypothetical protein AVEN_189112-1, partial [Araneus ventricosus]